MSSGMTNERYREKVREMPSVKDGEVEVDDDARVSRNDERGGDNGAYVQVWMWVPDDGTGAEQEVVVVTCPECGENDADPREEGGYVCNACGKEFELEGEEG